MFLTENTYQVLDVVAMERRLLSALDFQLWTPEPAWFLRLAVDATDALANAEKDVALLRSLYLLDLLLAQPVWRQKTPSLLAAAALALVLEVAQGIFLTVGSCMKTLAPSDLIMISRSLHIHS